MCMYIMCMYIMCICIYNVHMYRSMGIKEINGQKSPRCWWEEQIMLLRIDGILLYKD